MLLSHLLVCRPVSAPAPFFLAFSTNLSERELLGRSTNCCSGICSCIGDCLSSILCCKDGGCECPECCSGEECCALPECDGDCCDCSCPDCDGCDCPDCSDCNCDCACDCGDCGTVLCCPLALCCR